MNEQNKKEQQLFIIDGQLIGCILYIVSLLISVVIIINQRKLAMNQEGFLTSKESQTLALWNKILIILLIIWFLYLNNEAKNFAADTNQDTSSLELQILATIISFIPALIGLYVVATDFSNTNLQTAEIENPFV